MTDNMIERVAKVFEADDRISQFMARRLAREAIEAMREPTNAMLKVIDDGDFLVNDFRASSADATELWQAMINTALEKEQPNRHEI